MKIGDAIKSSVESVSKDWTAYRKKEYRDQRRGARARAELYRTRRSLKDICSEFMKEAYLKASANNTLPAEARQIFYQMRPLVATATDETLDDQYFTQTLLPDYLNENALDWDVVFDARGHLWEPHTGKEVQLGTLSIRRYLKEAHADLPEFSAAPSFSETSDFPTKGPANRYRNVLFIEKEGFLPLFERAGLKEKYDLAIMSTKGMSSTAARELMEGLDGVRFLVLHDLDKSGFSIVGTLQRDTRRYSFSRPPEVIDLGLRLDDVLAEGLEGEPVSYRVGRDFLDSLCKIRVNLEENGASPDEIDFLANMDREHPWKRAIRGKRVELNAFTSDHFLRWIEKKLEEHAVEKLVPTASVLEVAYRRALFREFMEEAIEEAKEEAQAEAGEAKLPKALVNQVKAMLKKNPMLSWDAAVATLASARREP